MDNMAKIIRRHNAKILRPVEHSQQLPCNCRKKDECPLNGECRAPAIIYKASVTSDEKTDCYFGHSEPQFKFRYANHKCTFRHRSKRSHSTLAGHIWDLKDQNKTFEVAWDIVTRSKPYQNGAKHCSLCTAEKLAIIFAPQESLINSRNELVSHCKQKEKFSNF